MRLRLLAISLLLGVVVLISAAIASGWGDGGSRSEHWGVITRNTIGSPVGDHRNGPYGSFGVTGPEAAPPYGTGSLGIAVSAGPPAEKVDFGNEVDFFGDSVLALTQVGFHVFQTGENATPNPENMPNIRLEIDPNGAINPSNYTTMVWVPDAAPVVNQWSGFIDATSTGYWYFTGSTGVTTGCNQATQCSFAQAKNSLNDGQPDPMIYTVAVGKGRDQTWVGAIDGLRINQDVYDFEFTGVFVDSDAHDDDDGDHDDNDED
jgi:hypothetical protein